MAQPDLTAVAPGGKLEPREGVYRHGVDVDVDVTDVAIRDVGAAVLQQRADTLAQPRKVWRARSGHEWRKRSSPKLRHASTVGPQGAAKLIVIAAPGRSVAGPCSMPFGTLKVADVVAVVLEGTPPSS